MTLKIWELISIVFAALVAGMFCGPWVAVSRSFNTFNPEVFLAISQQMGRNMESVMTVLMPTALLSILPVLLLSFNAQPKTFYLASAGLALFIVALLVTILVEVPIVKQIEAWTIPTLPGNWQQLRDRWGSFHIVRVAAGLSSLILLLIGAIF